jgi:undecaprenyl-diphosphatase
VLQLGTLAAVVGFFLRDLLSMIQAVLDPKRRRGPEARRLLYMIVGTIPVGVAGILFKHAIEGPLRSLSVIATSLIVVGLLMGLTEKLAAHRRSIDDMTMRDALIIGLAQALALDPGVSRSGITLVGAHGPGAAAGRGGALLLPALGAGGGRGSGVRAAQGAADAGPRRRAARGRAAGGRGVRLPQHRVAAALSPHAHHVPFVIYRVAIGAALLLAIARGWLPNAETAQEGISVRIATHLPGHVE